MMKAGSETLFIKGSRFSAITRSKNFVKTFPNSLQKNLFRLKSGYRESGGCLRAAVVLIYIK